MARVLIVPGLAVRGYAEPAADALREHGHEAELLPPPTWRGTDTDLRGYGRDLAARINREQRPVQLLVGLSVGTQAAAVAAAGSAVERLLLISPTVDPGHRNRLRLLTGWLQGEDHPDAPKTRQQIPDWRQAGVSRIFRGFTSATRVHLEDALPAVRSRLVIAHSDVDQLSDHAYAAGLARRFGGRLVIVPDAPHSWPIGDPVRFIELVEDLLSEPAPSAQSSSR